MAGARTIATAPTLTYGVPVTGGGEDEYYRVTTFEGDQLTLDAASSNPVSSCDAGFYLYPPSTTDASVSQDKFVQYGFFGQLAWRVPFSGVGILQTRGCPYTLTVDDAHQTYLTIAAPVVARRFHAVAVTATVHSIAGIPTGTCLIDGLPVLLHGSICTRKVRLTARKHQALAVEFLPEGGWLPAEARRSVRIVTKHR